jgi:CrcB protein
MPHLVHALLLGLAGAAGTLLRAGCTNLAARWCGVAFPWGTLTVNLAGSFAFGLVVGLARSRAWMTPAIETLLLVGLLGGFTTYSSFAFQSLELAQSGRMVPAVAYVAATNACAVLAAWAGLRAGGG